MTSCFQSGAVSRDSIGAKHITPRVSFFRADAFSVVRGGRLSFSCAHGIHVSFFSNGYSADTFSSPHRHLLLCRAYAVWSFSRANRFKSMISLSLIIDERNRRCQGAGTVFGAFFSIQGPKPLLISPVFFAKISLLHC